MSALPPERASFLASLTFSERAQLLSTLSPSVKELKTQVVIEKMIPTKCVV